jgi:hypothetical protein
MSGKPCKIKHTPVPASSVSNPKIGIVPLLLRLYEDATCTGHGYIAVWGTVGFKVEHAFPSENHLLGWVQHQPVNIETAPMPTKLAILCFSLQIAWVKRFETSS